MSAGCVAYVGDAISGLDFSAALAEQLSAVTVLRVDPEAGAALAGDDRVSCLVVSSTAADALAAALGHRSVGAPLVVPGDADTDAFPDDARLLTLDGDFTISGAVETVASLLDATPDGGVATAAATSRDRADAADLLDVALEESLSGVFEVGITSESVRVDGTAAALLGVERPDAIDGFEGLLDCIRPDDRTDFEAAIGQALEGDGQFRCEFRLDGDEHTRWIDARGELQFDDGTPGTLVGVLQDATERKSYEQTLAGLNDASRRLLEASGRMQIGETVRDAATDLLGLSGVGVFLFDDDREGLAPAALSTEFADALGEVPPVWPTEGVVWNVYETGEPRVLDGGPGSEDSPVGAGGGGLVVPIGAYGVLAAGILESTHVDGRTVELAQTLAANAAAALARTERERQLRIARERMAAVLDRIDGLVQDVMGDLTTADTVSEVYERVCERVTDTDPYVFAWVGDADLATDDLVARAWTGEIGADPTDLVVSLDDADTVPVANALATREPQLVVGDDATLLPASADAIPADAVGSGLALSLSYRESVYGVLAVYAPGDDAFTDNERAVLSAIADATAQTIHAMEQAELFTAGQITELELETAAADAVVTGLSRAANCPVSLADATSYADGEQTLFVTASDVDRATLVDAAEGVAGVTGVAYRTGAEDEHVLEVTVDRPTIVADFANYAGAVTAVEAAGGVATVTVQFPSKEKARAAFRARSETDGSLSLVATRDRERTGDSSAEFRSRVDEQLTDRQHEVLRLAHLSGYYDWPRATSGDELAESMDLSRPTFHQHMRAAEGKLVATLFETATIRHD